MLARRGVQVEAWLLSDKAHAEGRAALERAGGRVVTEPTRRPEVVVDGIVGIGGRGGLRDDAANALKLLHGVPVVAVDTPSGVDVDTGEVASECHHVDAALTVTFGTHKVCHLVDPAAQACGAVHLVDIGLDLPEPELEALQPDDVAALLPRPTAAAQKYTRGVVGVRAGSAEYPGAALLSVAGAACGLAGMVRYVGDEAVAELVKAQHPEVVGEGRVQAWVVGSGGGESAGDELAAALDDGSRWSSTRTPSSTSWDGSRSRPCSPRTPASSPRCSARSAPDIEARPLHFAREAAGKYDATVLLKGRRTVIARPDGKARVNTTGTAWLATAGAGDVLGGVVGALLAAGLTAYDAASVGAWLHGAAATLASDGGPLVAGWVAEALPERRRRTAAVTARAELVVDVAAIRHNVRLLKELTGTQYMAVVKADGYGHGLAESAKAAREGGADWLGVATIDEALALRAAGDTGRVLCWLTVPGDDWAAAIERDVDVTAYSVDELDAIAGTGRRARVQLKVDTGLHRGGATLSRLGRRGRSGQAGRGRAELDGHGHLVALLLQRRAGRPGQRRAGAAVQRGSWSVADGSGAGARGHPPRQLRRRDPAPELAARPGARAASRRTASTPPPASPPTSGCGPR